MREDEFAAKLRTPEELDSNDRAQQAIDATFDTLRERLVGNEPRNLASQLPPEIAGPLDGGGFSISEFYDRVADEAASREDAMGHARAVTATVREMVTAGELDDVRERIKGEFEKLVGSKGDA